MLPVIEWDDGTQIVRASEHRATRRTYECAGCGKAISIGQRYQQIVAWGLRAFVRVGIAGLFVDHKRELQRDVVCMECVK